MEKKKCTSHIILLWIRIAEKLEFIMGRVVKICTKASIGGKAEHNKTFFRANFQ